LIKDDVGDSREERAFRMWINSLGMEDVNIQSLYEGCNDGLVLLHTLDHIQPGIVAWKQVEQKPTNKFKKVSNCNYLIVLGKQLKFSLVGIGGEDITHGNKKLVLALVWQMMRNHTLKFVAATNEKKFGAGKEVSEDMIIKWANEKVKSAGKSTSITSFKDPAISTGLFYLDLLTAIEPRIIDQQYITPGSTPEDKLLNAKYAISVARKLGAVIFLLPEDIVEVKPKMILTFTASVMALEK